MFAEEYITEAAFKRSADREILTKQQRMQDDIDAYSKTQVKLKISARINSDFPNTCRAPKRNKKGVEQYASKMLIAELGKRVEKYDLINSLAQAIDDSTFFESGTGIF